MMRYQNSEIFEFPEGIKHSMEIIILSQGISQNILEK